MPSSNIPDVLVVNFCNLQKGYAFAVSSKSQDRVYVRIEKHGTPRIIKAVGKLKVIITGRVTSPRTLKVGDHICGDVIRGKKGLMIFGSWAFLEEVQTLLSAQNSHQRRDPRQESWRNRSAPPPRPPVKTTWRTILGFSENDALTKSNVQARFRKLAKQHHPDVGGNCTKMAEISAAYKEAERYL